MHEELKKIVQRFYLHHLVEDASWGSDSYIVPPNEFDELSQQIFQMGTPEDITLWNLAVDYLGLLLDQYHIRGFDLNRGQQYTLIKKFYPEIEEDLQKQFSSTKNIPAKYGWGWIDGEDEEAGNSWIQISELDYTDPEHPCLGEEIAVIMMRNFDAAYQQFPGLMEAKEKQAQLIVDSLNRNAL